MAAVLNWIWQGSAVAIAASLALRLLGRSRAQHRYALCWVALAMVLFLPVRPPLWVASAQAGTSPATAAFEPLLVAIGRWWMPGTVVLVLWGLWSIAQGARLVRATIALRNTKRRCRPFPRSLESRLRYWTAARRTGRCARLVVSDDVRAAAVLGGKAPVIAVAPALLTQLSADALDRVVIHEWAHVQRRDDVTIFVQQVARTVAGWHPGVWWLTRQLQIECESACDEAAVSMTGSSKEYAACLATVAALSSGRLDAMLAPGALSSSGLARRLVRILSHSHLTSPTRSMRVASFAALVFCALTVTIPGLRIVHGALEPADISVVDAVVPDSPTASAQSRDSSGASMPPPVASRRKTSSKPSVAPPERVPPSSPTLAPTPARTEHSGLPRIEVGAVTPLDQTRALRDVPLRITSPGERPAREGDGTSVTSPVRSPNRWGVAADTGVAIGRGSQQAAVSTAGFFSRFGKKIARSF